MDLSTKGFGDRNSYSVISKNLIPIILRKLKLSNSQIRAIRARPFVLMSGIGGSCDGATADS